MNISVLSTIEAIDMNDDIELSDIILITVDFGEMTRRNIWTRLASISAKTDFKGGQ